jgi:hypothetical protein
VELLSLDFPRPVAGLMVMPTTVQANDSGLTGYVRNALRRGAVRNLWLLLLRGRSTDWLKLARSLLVRAVEQGGVFHLWGHSWELDAFGLWGRLEDALRLMSEFAPQASALTNGGLVRWVEERSDEAHRANVGVNLSGPSVAAATSTHPTPTGGLAR